MSKRLALPAGHKGLLRDGGPASAIGTSLGRAPPSATPSSRRTREVAKAKASSWPVTVFLFSLMIPWIITVGPLRMSAYRLVLLVMLAPLLVAWLGGKAGRFRVADFALVGYCSWCFVSICVIHGLAYAVQPAGMIFIETIGAYLLARCYIRSADDFRGMVSVLFTIVALLLPFAFLETVTTRNVLLEWFASVLPTFQDRFMDPRWGLRRAQSVFEHPILYGVFCASCLSLTHLVLGEGKSFARRWSGTGIVAAAAFVSLSAGPLTALTSQTMLLGWNWLLRAVAQRWTILLGFALLAVVSIELLASRSIPVVFMSYFSFDEASAWVRVEIWRYGTASILNHPLFGVGFGEWDRAPWMAPSIDMFWIIDGIRHGIPAEALMLLAFASLYLAIAFKAGLDTRSALYRTAYLVAMTGFFLVGWTVYFWSATYVLFLFLLGSGAWMLDQPGEGAVSIGDATGPVRRSYGTKRMSNRRVS